MMDSNSRVAAEVSALEARMQDIPMLKPLIRLLLAEISEAEKDTMAVYAEGFLEAPVVNLYLHSEHYSNAVRWPATLKVAPGERKIVLIARSATTGVSRMKYGVEVPPVPPAGMRFRALFGELPRYPARERGVLNYDTNTYQHKDSVTALTNMMNTIVPGLGATAFVYEQRSTPAQ